MDIGLLGGIAEGLKTGLGTYMDLQERNRKIAEDAEDRKYKRAMMNVSAAKEGLIFNPESGEIVADPSSDIYKMKQQRDQFGLLKTAASGGLLPKYSEAGQIVGFERTPESEEEKQLDLKIKRKKAQQPEGNEFQKTFDRKTAQELTKYLTEDKPKLTENLNKIDEVLVNLKNEKEGSGFFSKAQKQAGGLLAKKLPSFGAVLAPDTTKNFENIALVVQEGLRPTLGPQFTEKEGEALISRSYNPQMPTEENIKRIQRLKRGILGVIQAKDSMVRYAQENGTLKGYKGPLSNVIGSTDDMNVVNGNLLSALKSSIDSDEGLENLKIINGIAYKKNKESGKWLKQ